MTNDRIVCEKLKNGGIEYREIVCRVFEAFPLTDTQLEEGLESTATMIERRLPDFIRACAIEGALPFMQADAEWDFQRRKGVPFDDAKSLVSALATKVLDRLFGRAPWGNARKWGKRIAYNLFADYCRERETERRFRRQWTAMRHSTEYGCRVYELIMFEEWLAGLPTIARQIVTLVRDGAKLADVANELEMSTDEVERIIQDVEGPDGESPRRNRRRRKRLS